MWVVGVVLAALAGGPRESAAQVLAGGSTHSVAVRPDGTVWAWGGNTNGQLGDTTTTERRVPTETGLTDVVAVAAGDSHSLALTTDGSVLAWGLNSSGQLGDGTTTSRSVPTAVSGLPDIVAIEAGGAFSVALDATGLVWAWGGNADGQLGVGTTTSSSVPVAVTTLTNVVSIAAGQRHVLAVKSDGTVWSWGLNATGQLGDGTTTARNLPTQVSGVSTATHAAAGLQHSLVRLSDGTLRSWGYNNSGNLGDGTYTQRLLPVTVSGLTNVTAIATGNGHNVARRSDGSLYAWGTGGAVGDGTSNYRNVPVQVQSSGTVSVGAGGSHSLAMTSSGVVQTWGSNANGRLGDGTTESGLSPQAISDVGVVWMVGKPTLSVAPGTYSTDQTVTVASATPGATLHYTLDGTEPTPSAATVVSGGTLSVDRTFVLKVRGFSTVFAPSRERSGTYTMVVANLVRSVNPGTFTSPQILTLTTTTPGATIRYTTDGSPVSAVAPIYTDPLPISTSTVVRAAAYRTDWTTSFELTGTYTMNFGALNAPGFSVGTGTYTSGVTLTITAVPGVTVRYTTNGTTPTAASPIYVGPIDVAATQTVKAQAVHPDYTSSPVTSATFTIVVAAPDVSHTSGSYPAGTAITAVSATPGATVRYTLSGTDPTETDPAWPAAGLVVANVTVRLRAFKAGCVASGTLQYQYGADGTFTPYQVTGSRSGGSTFAVRTDGTLWAWGNNASGRLGDGTTTLRALPVQVGLTGVSQISAGNTHTLALRLGEVWSWGVGTSGQLGAGAVTSRSRPGLIDGLSDVVAIATGASHSVALRADGTVWTWGANTYGQLGLGSTTSASVPTQVAGVTAVTAIAAGETHTVVVRSDGTAWAWGRNANGQLGDGSTSQRTSPVQVSGLAGIVVVGGGLAHSLAIDGTGQLWGWGQEDRFGINTTGNTVTPLAHPTLVNATALSVADNSTLVRRADGSVVAFGTNANGQLGIWTNYQSTTPPVGLGGSPPAASQIAITGTHGVFTTSDGVVYTWGYNGNGQLGDGTTTAWFLPTAISEPGMIWRLLEPTLGVASGRYFTALAVPVTGLPGGTLHYTLDGSDPTIGSPTVASGATVAITQSAVLTVRQFVSGAPPSQPISASYELQVPAPVLSPATGTYSAPALVTIAGVPGATVRYATTGREPGPDDALYTTALSLTATSTVRARAYLAGWTPSVASAASYWMPGPPLPSPTLWPAGGVHAAPLMVTVATAVPDGLIRYTVDGSLPTVSSPVYREPLLVGATTTVRARVFRAGATPSAVVAATYETDDPARAGTPAIAPAGGQYTTQQTVTVTGPVGSTLRYTLTGADPTTADATIISGSTLTLDRAVTLKVRAWASGLEPSVVRQAAFLITGDIDAGWMHSVALTATGDVYAWGDNRRGQVGVPGSLYHQAPVFVMGSVRAIAAGRAFTLALKHDGTLLAWGLNLSGQLGDGTRTTRPTPTAVPGLTQVVAIAAGSDHALALRDDGTVWAWGSNAAGQLGDGSLTDRWSPVALPGLHGVTAIRAGTDASLARGDGGAGRGVLWAWGGNTAGQLGDGGSASSAVPIRVASLDDVQQFGAGDQWAMATRTDVLWTWGANTYGQLGTGSVQSRSTPMPLPTGDPLTSVDAGWLHGLGTDARGTVWGWGYSGWSQLGDAAAHCPNLGCRVPVRVPSLTHALRASGGYQHSLALRADGHVLAIGTNSAGQLGDGTYTLRPSAVVVPGLVLASNAGLLDDPDGDRLPTWREYLVGTDPFNADTNGNGFGDGDDLLDGSASHPDPDGDGVPSSVERARGTDPLLADTDADGVPDGLDAFPLDPTRSAAPTPTPGDVTPPVITLTAPTSAQPYPPPP